MTVIAKERLIAPQLVIEAIRTGNANITLGHIRPYIVNELQQELQQGQKLKELTTKYQKDNDLLIQECEKLKSGTIVIQGSRCAACHHPLELPTIHFLCMHSYHQHCFQSFTEDEQECPACQPKNKDLLELLKAREYNKDLHETFHSQLEKAHDGFSVVAEYFGRGVFNKYKLLIDDELKEKGTPRESIVDSAKALVVRNVEKEERNYGSGAEAKIRKSENARSNNKVIIPTPEGRVRLQEHRYSTSLEANLSLPVKSTDYSSSKKDNYSSSVTAAKNYNNSASTAKANPFENDYDEAKNPFAKDDDDLDENNPFRDDYDKNLNPFSDKF